MMYFLISGYMCILKFMLFSCVICIFFSCSSFHKEQLENALSFATFNRLELEKVLKHYEHDSLKRSSIN